MNSRVSSGPCLATTSNQAEDVSNSDEDDYMSDTVLTQCKDVRPGVLNRAAARQLKIERQKEESNRKNKTPKLKELESEKREVGLKQPLPAENKGFALLAKMGYRPGMAIGRNSGDDSARKEPVEVQLKTDRKGLGHATEQKRKAEEVTRHLEARRQKLDRDLLTDYRTRKLQDTRLKKLKRDLELSQKSCKELDLSSDIGEPSIDWYWPQYAVAAEEAVVAIDDDEEEEEEEELDMASQIAQLESQLDSLTIYLRESYNYCHWCGTKYEDDEDLGQNCPGPGASAHDD